MIKTEKCTSFIELCKNSKWVTNLHRISGEYNFLVTIQTKSLPELTSIQETLKRFGPSKSFISMENLI
ncbi:Lrp/AsnC ligand binding domain-containing protein [Shimazuella soli]|uniref:Lrp/AsnC ligand binding domain-containing protein n=1 Tax=Shimazuella soli TaxID=1892854 RepID=UPI001F0D2E52|nr:Lrp/AsnC ligand binding domain-containing protein [Shimazuella soli]